MRNDTPGSQVTEAPQWREFPGRGCPGQWMDYSYQHLEQEVLCGIFSSVRSQTYHRARKKSDIIGHNWIKLSQTSRLAIRTQMRLLVPWRWIHNWWKLFPSCPNFQGMLLISGQGWQRQLGCSQEILLHCHERWRALGWRWTKVINQRRVSVRLRFPWFCFSRLSQPRKALFAQNSPFQSNLDLFLARNPFPVALQKFVLDSSSHQRLHLLMTLG